MEQTLGKRIAEHRKRLKLTQDGLAEQLGLTAQAVSKWENDQSCPDITMLPKLAEIFGITTDELLGMEPPQKVHEAEVVSNQTSDVQFNIDHKKGGTWEFHWDSGRGGAIAFAVTVLAVGLLTLASRIENWNVSFWEILWPCALMSFGMTHIIKEFSVFHLSVLLFGGYGLLNNLGFIHFGYDGRLVFPIILVLFGLSLLTDALKKPKKPRFSVIRNDGKAKKYHSECRETDGRFYCDQSFGENTHYVTVERLLGGEIDVSFGELTVDLTGCTALGDGCTIGVDCSFGEVKLLVPRKFRVEPESDTAFASMSIHGHPDIEAVGIIHLDADISFGEVQIRYI